MKIVINACYGGFGLSEEGMKRYTKLKGIRIYPEKTKYGFTVYWTVPKNKRVKPLGDHPTTEEIIKYNKTYDTQTIYDQNIERDDPALVQAVEELREMASGSFAQLKIVKIPDDVQWEIDEYDGVEHIDEIHRTWG